MRLEIEIVEKFVMATGAIMTQCWPEPDAARRVTVTFTYAPTGWLDERDLAYTAAQHHVDVVHLEFDPDREFGGPANFALSEESDGAIHTWPRCRLWANADRRIVLIVPEGQDFGFGYDGAALVRVTDLETGRKIEEGAERARNLLMAAALRVPSDAPRVRQEFNRRPRGKHVS